MSQPPQKKRKVESDQPSIIKHLIMQHVQEDINRPDYRELADTINQRTWVIMKPGVYTPDDQDQQMCRIVHAHGEYAYIQLCYEDSEPYSMSSKIVVLHLSKWSEYFVEFHTDFFEMADSWDTMCPRIIEKS